MARIIDSTQVAIVYETITGQCQKRAVITTDTTEDIDAILARNIGMEAVIVAKSTLPGPDQNEDFFRQTVAKATGTAVFGRGADRCVQVGPNAVTAVISVHYGNVSGLDAAATGNTLVANAYAEVGDTFTHALGTFTRRYAVVDPTTGIVNRIVNMAVGPSEGTRAVVGDMLVPSQTLNVGNVIALKSVAV